jgi:hypothetical protein
MAETLVSDIQTNIKNKIGLSSAEGSLVLTWLTQGYRDILEKTHFYVSKTTISLTATVDEFQLATTISEIDDVTVTTSLVKPDRVTYEEILDLRRYANSGTSEGDVYCYAIYGNLLAIYPTPTTTTTMTIYYIAEPTTLGADFGGSEKLITDLHMLPYEPLRRALEYYGLWQAAEYDDKTTSAAAKGYLDLYEKFIIEARKAVRRRSGRGLLPARVGYPVKRGYPQRNDQYPSVSRSNG